MVGLIEVMQKFPCKLTYCYISIQMQTFKSSLLKPDYLNLLTPFIYLHINTKLQKKNHFPIIVF